MHRSSRAGSRPTTEPVVTVATSSLPRSAAHVVVGGGVHGLSTAAALARRLRTNGGAPAVVLLERSRLGSGASGIAGGIVRGYYRSPAIMELVRLSAELFERGRDAFGFRQVGFVSAVPERQLEDLEAIAGRQAEVGYDSELVVGTEACADYLTWLWPDFDARGVAAALHERRGGWADAAATIRELARAARAAGVTILEGVEMLSVERHAAGGITVHTAGGSIDCDHLVLACGVWAREAWRLLGLDFTVDADDGPKPLLDFVKAQEGDFVLPGVGLQPAAGHQAPVVHYDAEGPLESDRDGRVLVDGPWGVYFRMGQTGTGIAVGGLPVRLGPDAQLDPYGPENPLHVAGDEFCEFAESALARVLRRFRGAGDRWQAKPHGGVVGLTPDGYPVLDHVLDGVYAIVDAGHTYKLLALGELVARDILDGPEPRLEPFRLGRFEAGRLQPASRGPYPWT
jgi:methylglutamate dehydrogenase subunit A